MVAWGLKPEVFANLHKISRRRDYGAARWVLSPRWVAVHSVSGPDAAVASVPERWARFLKALPFPRPWREEPPSSVEGAGIATQPGSPGDCAGPNEEESLSPVLLERRLTSDPKRADYRGEGRAADEPRRTTLYEEE